MATHRKIEICHKTTEISIMHHNILILHSLLNGNVELNKAMGRGN